MAFCSAPEVLGLFLSKLDVVTTCDDKLKEEMQKMSNHISESDLLVKQLKVHSDWNLSPFILLLLTPK